MSERVVSQDANSDRFQTYTWPSVTPGEIALGSEIAPSDGEKMQAKKYNLKILVAMLKKKK